LRQIWTGVASKGSTGVSVVTGVSAMVTVGSIVGVGTSTGSTVGVMAGGRGEEVMSTATTVGVGSMVGSNVGIGVSVGMEVGSTVGSATGVAVGSAGAEVGSKTGSGGTGVGVCSTIGVGSRSAAKVVLMSK